MVKPTEAPATTFEQFVAEAQPLTWGSRVVMKVEKWFEWPPDVFALSSLLLSHTGAYRRVVSPPDGETWPRPDWPRKARRLAHKWRNWVADGKTRKHPLAKYRAHLQKLGDVTIDQLYDPQQEQVARKVKGGTEARRSWKLTVKLLELLSIADETMRGTGIVFAPRTTLANDENGEHADDLSERLSAFYLKANFLLALRGSLSRVPKYRGIVLPKARTPQVGLTLRSFSNNLTFHQTEVDVAWRSFPWFNFEENTLNLLIVPWPFEIKARAFQPLPHPKASSLLGQDRYFHYVPDSSTRLDVDGVARAIKRAEHEVRRIHALVFPEMSLRRTDLDRLKIKLEERLSPQHIPMIITGSGARFKDSRRAGGGGRTVERYASVNGQLGRQLRENLTPGEQAEGYNRVLLSAYYAGRWHDVLQDKHHRWKLDRRQIEQYKLGGVLSGARSWWEGIQIFRRRLSVLSVNSWLTICPLICEDLARLDPVSELVRGIGPTLLIALLMDGPQLKERWPARYASVFADDPGSSVLTVTSLGMSRRSIIVGNTSAEALELARKGSSVIAQWKDQLDNWHTIQVADGVAPVKRLTIGALWKSEMAFDGRTDRESSGVFVYEGMDDDDLAEGSGEEPEEGHKDGEGSVQEAGNVAEGTAPAPSWYGMERAASKEHAEATVDPRKGEEEDSVERADDAVRKLRSLLDMVELTLFTFYTDAVVDATEVVDTGRLWRWFLAATDCADRCPVIPSTVYFESFPDPRLRNPDHSDIDTEAEPAASSESFDRELLNLLVYSIETRDLIPRNLPTPHLLLATEGITDLVQKALRKTERKAEEEEMVPWRRLFAVAFEWMNKVHEAMSADLRWMKDHSEPVGEPGQFSIPAGSFGALVDAIAEERKGTVRHDPEQSVVRFRGYEVGRILLMAPLAVLWAIHSRLTTKRRFGRLTAREAELLVKIEETVDDEAYHKTHVAWRDQRKRSRRI